MALRHGLDYATSKKSNKQDDGVSYGSVIERDSRHLARLPLTHAGDLLLIENLELLVDEFEIRLDLGEQHILDGSRTALGAHIFPHQPPQVERAHGNHQQRLEQRAIVASTVARFGRGIDRQLSDAGRACVRLHLEEFEAEEPGAAELEIGFIS